MAVVATYSSWAIVSGYVNCVPVAKFWNHDLPGTCLNFEAVWFFNASMNIATDVTLLILPMPLLVQLQLPRMQKIALVGVFAIGILYVPYVLFAGSKTNSNQCCHYKYPPPLQSADRGQEHGHILYVYISPPRPPLY